MLVVTVSNGYRHGASPVRTRIVRCHPEYRSTQLRLASMQCRGIGETLGRPAYSFFAPGMADDDIGRGRPQCLRNSRGSRHAVTGLRSLFSSLPIIDVHAARVLRRQLCRTIPQPCLEAYVSPLRAMVVRAFGRAFRFGHETFDRELERKEGVVVVIAVSLVVNCLGTETLSKHRFRNLQVHDTELHANNSLLMNGQHLLLLCQTLPEVGQPDPTPPRGPWLHYRGST